ncbi:MAG: branched-chain-amino-acid transaminase [Candidatus Hodarchaeota archaeon]
MESDKELFVYINGELIPLKEAKISVLDRCFVYGDGVFEGIQVIEGGIVDLDKHIKRLFRSTKCLKIDVPVSEEEIREAIIRVVRESDLRDGYIRPIISRGEGPLGLERMKELSMPNIVIIPQIRPVYSDRVQFEEGLSGKVVSTRRTPAECLDPRIKSCNYLNNVLAKIEQLEAGAQVGIMLDIDGFVSEECGKNIFVVKDSALYTPRRSRTLEGITRENIIEIAQTKGWKSIETDLTLYDLYTADEVFVCATMSEATPVVNIDGRKIGKGKPGPITIEIVKLLREKMKDESTKVF